ncbi:MAG: prefoldin subunit [Candidatus Micrarchaeota archaeon]|nr:prefoldin subunit [Candidatus Micrarchaeota archaeon]
MDREQLEKLSREYSLLQEQIQSLAIQREQFLERKDEYKEAFKEIENASGKVYLAIGGAIVEVQKDYALKSIKEKEEVAEMRVSIVKKQYDELVKKEQTLRNDINTGIKELKG